jgi:hypothetical protein
MLYVPYPYGTRFYISLIRTGLDVIYPLSVQEVLLVRVLAVMN